ncbi:hypothetical protein EUGRSUZ_L02646 [Eucalyptus grandis]|uniref:Protein kinase domain-containing protein n=1 Tax=Eucalyptus grandis TaxID=71139 RepID=A0AAD9T9W2_EUCGR|nr:hypothetical protein EUGRSUZ_L02646 [Eucalyptus grandis]
MNSSIQAIVAAVASLVGVSLFLVCLAITCNWRRRKTISNSEEEELSFIAGTESASFDPKLWISMAELRTLIIGDGSFGLVYKGRLANGLTVAIKKLEPDAFEGFQEFRAEMEALGKLHHPNIVKLLGYWMSNSDRVLVYEFIEKGSLDQWLYDTTSSSENGDISWSRHSVERPPLSWDTRMKIIRGVATGLAYMHGLPMPIIHRGIKASDVLLDAEFEPHIADFGLARMIKDSRSHVSTQFGGTMGYAPPEYKEGFTAATVKADVYSFGVLMVEIATGRRPDLSVVDKGEEVEMTVWARNMVDENRQMEMVDPAVSRDGLVEARVEEYFSIACMCTSHRNRDRPGMSRVLELLMSAFG